MQKKLLIYRWGSISEPSLVEAVKEIGWPYAEFAKEMKDYHSDGGFAGEMMKVIHGQQIGAVFSYDYFPLISMICEINQIPYLSWIYDCPQYTLQSETLKSPCNQIFCFDESYARRIMEMGAVSCFHFPLAGVSRQLAQIEEKERKNPSLGKKYKCDISFVGNLYNEDKNRLRRAGLSEYASGFVEGLVESQLMVYGYNFLKESMPEQLVKELVEKCGLFLGEGYRQDDVQMAADAVGMEVTGRERERTLDKISEKYPIHFYTSSKLPAGLIKENIKNMGYADYQKEMPFIFHNSRINLNITSRTIETGIPQRVFDILSCGGFCLTSYQPEIDQYFTDGEDLAMYTSLEELMDKAEYYLTHEKERSQIARNGHRRIREDFELKDKLAELLQRGLLSLI
jgi:spore maturation protein CgeB